MNFHKCREHFPSLYNEATQLRLLNLPLNNELSVYDSDGNFAYSKTTSMILFNITESHCEDIMMFAGCQLHWTRSICSESAYDIVKRIFSAYNNMSGKKCSGNHELLEDDFKVLEKKYKERYLYLEEDDKTSMELMRSSKRFDVLETAQREIDSKSSLSSSSQPILKISQANQSNKEVLKPLSGQLKNGDSSVSFANALYPSIFLTFFELLLSSILSKCNISFPEF